MKIYVFVSAMKAEYEHLDVMDVQLFATEPEAIKYLEETVVEHTSDEGGWDIDETRPNCYYLTDGGDEYVAYVEEREI